MPPPVYPIQKLLFFVAQDFDEPLVSEIKGFTQTLSASRDWSVAAPVFVNESAEGIRTLGGYLSIFSALPPNQLPAEIDRHNLEEVKDLVSGFRALSLERKLAFELELDGVPVGGLEDGRPDRNLRIGLVEEWERALAGREETGASDES